MSWIDVPDRDIDPPDAHYEREADCEPDYGTCTRCFKHTSLVPSKGLCETCIGSLYDKMQRAIAARRTLRLAREQYRMARLDYIEASEQLRGAAR